MTADEVAKMLSVSRKFIEKHTAKNCVPGQIKVGRLWRYRKSAIQKAVLKGQFLIDSTINHSSNL